MHSLMLILFIIEPHVMLGYFQSEGALLLLMQ